MPQKDLMATYWLMSAQTPQKNSDYVPTYFLGRHSMLTSEESIKGLDLAPRVHYWPCLELLRTILIFSGSWARQRKAILQTADNQLLKALCECILNVLKETVPISNSEKQQLSRHKKTLIALADKKVPFHRKKKTIVQHGGSFFGSTLTSSVNRSCKFTLNHASRQEDDDSSRKSSNRDAKSAKRSDVPNHSNAIFIR